MLPTTTFAFILISRVLATATVAFSGDMNNSDVIQYTSGLKLAVEMSNERFCTKNQTRLVLFDDKKQPELALEYIDQFLTLENPIAYLGVQWDENYQAAVEKVFETLTNSSQVKIFPLSVPLGLNPTYRQLFKSIFPFLRVLILCFFTHIKAWDM